ncbi:MAG: hypothetical protein RLZZ461_1381 [Planctomycetota bacterium]
MQADSRVRLLDLMPTGALELLRGTSHRRDAVSVPSDADFVDALRSSGSPGIESAGTIGDGWFTQVSGDSWQVKASSGRFTWHSHAEGPAVFSVEDFLVFHTIGGAWHLLVTPSAWCVYLVVEAPRVELPIRSVLHSPPTLRMRRAARWAEETFGVGPPEVLHQRMCRQLGVRRFEAVAPIAGVSLWSELGSRASPTS